MPGRFLTGDRQPASARFDSRALQPSQRRACGPMTRRRWRLRDGCPARRAFRTALGGSAREGTEVRTSGLFRFTDSRRSRSMPRTGSTRTDTRRSQVDNDGHRGPSEVTHQQAPTGMTSSCGTAPMPVAGEPRLTRRTLRLHDNEVSG